jgi:hypothetical protein
MVESHTFDVSHRNTMNGGGGSDSPLITHSGLTSD